MAIAVAAIAIHPRANLWAHGAGGHGGSSAREQSRPTSGADAPRRTVPVTNAADRPMQPPHGGQVTATTHHYFEVVYTPTETRVYAFDASQRGLNARRLRGSAVLTVRSSGQSGSFPLEVVAQPAFTGDVGYLAARVDVSRVHDGDMDVRFDLAGLPTDEPQASFTQTFFLAKPPLQITPATLSAADHQPVALQGVCPVTETALGAHGDPIKLIVGGQAVYVCCSGCVQSVQNDPHGYVQKTTHIVQVNQAARRSPPPAQSRPQVVRAQLTADDHSLVQQQRICPVMDQPLGSHGEPIKLLVDGQPLYVCCEGCIEQVVEHPYPTLDKVARNVRAVSAPRDLAASVSAATSADTPAVRAQGVCPVMDSPLGEHGAPIKVTVGSRTMFVCCQGCIDEAVTNFDALSLKLAAWSATFTNNARQPAIPSQQDAWFYERPMPQEIRSGGSCCSTGGRSSCH